MNEKQMKIFKCFMLIVNIVMVNFIVNFILNVTNQMSVNGISRNFLVQVVAIPSNPNIIAWQVLGLSAILAITFVIREVKLEENYKWIYVTLGIDFLVIFLLMVLLNFNYNGLIFWVFANVIYYLKDRGRYVSLLLAIIFYVGTDFQVLSIQYRLYSIKSYFEYYSAGTQQTLTGIYNLLISVNIIFFIAFCVLVIQRQRGIIEEVNSLYQKLSDTNSELEEAVDELKKYADIKEKMGKTKERNRLAREIHDTLGHTLTGISAGIDACIAIIDIEPKKTKDQLNVLAKVTRTGIGEVRRSVNELRPDSLERLCLEQAIQQMIMEFKAVTNVRIEFQCTVKQLKFDEDEETIIFRIIQESITNAIRHGKADHIQVNVTPTLGEVHIVIKDNGIGCKEFKKGFGTKHMQERINMLKGSIHFEGEDGFKVEASIPIRWGEDYD